MDFLQGRTSYITYTGWAWKMLRAHGQQAKHGAKKESKYFPEWTIKYVNGERFAWQHKELLEYTKPKCPSIAFQVDVVPTPWVFV